MNKYIYILEKVTYDKEEKHEILAACIDLKALKTVLFNSLKRDSDNTGPVLYWVHRAIINDTNGNALESHVIMNGDLEPASMLFMD